MSTAISRNTCGDPTRQFRTNIGQLWNRTKSPAAPVNLLIYQRPRRKLRRPIRRAYRRRHHRALRAQPRHRRRQHLVASRPHCRQGTLYFLVRLHPVPLQSFAVERTKIERSQLQFPAVPQPEKLARDHHPRRRLAKQPRPAVVLQRISQDLRRTRRPRPHQHRQRPHVRRPAQPRRFLPVHPPAPRHKRPVAHPPR